MTLRPAAVAGMIRSILIYRAMPWRQRALKRFYTGLVAPGDLAFDIGAHVGNRTAALRSLGARVVAVEPQPAFAALLERLFRDEGVQLVRQAVGRAAGHASLMISSRHPTVSSLSSGWIDQVKNTQGFRQVQWDREVEVPVTTLDRLIDEFGSPAFCKIDVEGMEAEILMGLSQPIPLVAVEYLPSARNVAAACIERLRELGDYRFNMSVGETHRMCFAEWTSAAGILDALAQLAPDDPSGDIYARLAG